MKKIVALMMALCMMVCCGIAAADAEVNWEDFAGLAEQLELNGEWVANEEWNAGFYLPAGFVEGEMTDEYAEQGVLAYFYSEDGSVQFVIMSIDLPEGATDAASFVDALHVLGYEDAEVVIVNGYEMVTYTNTDADQLTAISVYDDGTGMAFAFSPASAEGMDMLASIMMASLLTYDEAVAVVAQQ